MLNIKIFGDGPAPAWTEDQASFKSWASCRIGRPSCAPKLVRQTPDPEKANEILKKSIKAWDEQPCPAHMVAWELQEESSFSFGWGAIRFSIKEESGQLRLDTDTWVFSGWCPMGPRHNRAMSLLLDLAAGRLGDLASINTERLDLFWSNCAPYAVAPWSTEDVVELGSSPLFCRIDENSNFHLLEIQGHYPSNHLREMLRWISHRLRYAARRWPALRWIWGAVRAHESKSLFPVSLALQALQHDPRWLKQAWDWLVFCETDLLQRPTLDWESVRFREYGPYDVRAIPDVFEKSIHVGHALCVGWARPCVRRWNDALPMAQALRLFKAIQNQEKANARGAIKQKSPAFMVVHALACARLPVPSILRLESMFKTPMSFMAWLLEQPDWCSSIDPWPYPHFLMEHDKCPQITYWREVLSTLKKEHLDNPVAFRALARAGQAWMLTPIKRKGMSVPETLTADEEVFSQLQSPALSGFLEWDRLGHKAPWISYVRLLRSARSKAMDFHAQTEQTGVAPEATATPNQDDAAWLSALGVFNVGDIKVTPLCRPSHLNSVGEFFQNCVVATNGLAQFVKAARANQQRFFRLESEDNLAFLALEQDSDEEAWIVDDVRGRFNKVATDDMNNAAKQVAQFYSLLVPVKPTALAEDDDVKG